MNNSTAKAGKRFEHVYYYAVGGVLMATVFTGFARTYYLKELYRARPLSLLLHTHGLVMTLWFLLFLVQVLLIAKRQLKLHRQLGVVGLALAAIVAGIATIVSVGLARRELQANPESKDAPLLLGLQLFAIVLVFIVLVSFGFLYRRRFDYHKRFMTLAMLSVMGPAVTRLPFLPTHNVAVAAVVTILIVLGCIVADVFRIRRLHPAFGWGGLLVIGSIFVIAPLSLTDTWIRATKWLVM